MGERVLGPDGRSCAVTGDGAHPRLTVFFDGDCPICAREIRMVGRRVVPGTVRFLDVRDRETDLAAYGLTQPEVLGSLHAVRDDGEVITGMDAVRALYRSAGLGLLASFTSLPLLRPLFDLLYGIFSLYRIPLGRIFGARRGSGGAPCCGQGPGS